MNTHIISFHGEIRKILLVFCVLLSGPLGSLSLFGFISKENTAQPWPRRHEQIAGLFLDRHNKTKPAVSIYLMCFLLSLFSKFIYPHPL